MTSIEKVFILNTLCANTGYICIQTTRSSNWNLWYHRSEMFRPSAMSSECLLMVTMKHREQVYPLPLYLNCGSNEYGENTSATIPTDRVVPLKTYSTTHPFAVVLGPSNDFHNVQMFRRCWCCCYCWKRHRTPLFGIASDTMHFLFLPRFLPYKHKINMTCCLHNEEQEKYPSNVSPLPCEGYFHHRWLPVSAHTLCSTQTTPLLIPYVPMHRRSELLLWCFQICRLSNGSNL